MNKFLRRLGALFIGIGLLVMLAAPAIANGYDSDQNHPGYWCDSGGYKIELDGGNSWISTINAPLVVVKSGTSNDIFRDVQIGDLLSTVSGKGISHLIVCLPPTTTTAPPSTTTTTSVPDTTTTTEIPPTTTTTIPPICERLDNCERLPETGGGELLGLGALGLISLVMGAGLLRAGRVA